MAGQGSGGRSGGSGDGRAPVIDGTRSQILAAAREVFGASGYDRGRTLEIAERAGLTERTVFRHFPTKSALFVAAVVDPFQEYVGQFVDEWLRRRSAVRGAWEETHQFYDGLLAVLEANHGLIMSLLAARSFGARNGLNIDGLDVALSDMLDRLVPTMTTESTDRSFQGDPATNIRLMVGLALSVSLHSDWLFAGTQPGRERLLDDLTRFTLIGLGSEHDSDRSPPA